MIIPYERKNLEWRPIIGYEDYGEVSNYGDIHVFDKYIIDKAGRNWHRKEKYHWSEDMQEMGGDNDQGRYLGVHLPNGKKEYSHRIAAKAFCPNDENKPEVNHLDANTHNNYCGCSENNYKDSNLEWVTRKENMEHASANGLINHESTLRKTQCAINRMKVDYDKIKRPVVQLLAETGEFIAQYESISGASRVTGIYYSRIQGIANHEKYRKTTGIYTWVYLDEYDKSKDYSVKADQGSGNRMPVAECDLEGNIIKTYSSPMEAERLNKDKKYNSKYIRDCAHGKRKTHKNRTWKFI